METTERRRLFATEKVGGRAVYRLQAATVAAGILLVLYYRATRVPAAGEGRVAWLGMAAAELWYAVYWVITQSVRWCPVRRRTFKDRLAERYEQNLPGVDIFVCTADPHAEPPSIVISTVLSVMAYNYPSEKISVYLSDDGGSILTFYALWEASMFAKKWLPFCRRYNIEPRSPAAYFSELEGHHNLCSPKEWSFIKSLYEEMRERIDSAVMSGKIPEEIKLKHKGFDEWNSEMTSKNHQPIVQVLIDGKSQNAVDDDGNVLPTLVYMAREKRPQYHHNFKAGALNALIRVSSLISDSPVILNVDCDMYSNNSDSVRDALCFFLDEEMSHKIGFVQYPQNYNNMTKNNIYGNSLNVINHVEMRGLDSAGGCLYVGTGCFHRREILCGKKFSKDYKEDWSRGIKNRQENINETEEKAKSLATCTYELRTQWGDEIGVKYGCPVEDVITGLAIHCRGWESVYLKPQRTAFVGLAPATLAQTILQHKRWSEGNHTIFLSKYCTFLFGHGKISLQLQMGYCIYGLWAANSLPTIYYVMIPALGLVKGTPLFPEIMSPWATPFIYVFCVKTLYSLYEALLSGDTLKGWWNGQRMWMVKRITSYLYGFIDTIRKLLGLSNMSFEITAKVILCGLIVVTNIPIYEAMFLRKDKGRIPLPVTLASIGFVIAYVELIDRSAMETMTAERRRRPLFTTEELGGRAVYRLQAATVAAGILLVLYYRATRVPAAGEGRAAWLGMTAAELWYAVYWVIAQSVRWRPVRRRTFRDRLAERYEQNLPGVDIFVCTADPNSEPPSLVISTILSVMAYNYPSEKISVYLSDDGGSILTFYALWEASIFAKKWLPFCKRYNIEPRSPAAYFSESKVHHNLCIPKEWALIKNLYEEMRERIDTAIMSGKIPEEMKLKHKGFDEWNSHFTLKNHQPIVQILIDGKSRNAIDDDRNVLPTLVYVAREKRPLYHHNFKAGALNALIRVSSVISDSPIILNVDCDMYSNNSDSIRDALCFFLDEEMGQKIGFVQYPQIFNNITRNDIYGNSFNVSYHVEMCGLDSVGGCLYIGTGCFHRREILCGRTFSKDYKENWNRGIKERGKENINGIEEKAKSLVTCTYEHRTQWGNDIGVKYGCTVEDIITGLAIHCRGWESAYINPKRAAFLGVAPSTLAQTILQHKRWSEGNLTIFLSKYCSFLFGHGKIKLQLQMGYCICGLWAANSLPTLYYVMIPSLGLVKGTPVFPQITSPWAIPFIHVFCMTTIYGLHEALLSGDTLKGWWNGQRMWMVKRITSYLYAFIDTIRKLLGMSKMSFEVTAKVSDHDEAKRHEQEILEFGSSSPEYVIIATVALLNFVCLVGGLSQIMAGVWNMPWNVFLPQAILCGMIVVINMPIYEAIFLRKDKGRIPTTVTLASIGFVMLALLVPLV
uniref:Cellulose synthase-like protein E6 n=1 Tax=Oryza punctata TaxID=4537 RepID=A0A0E0M2H5_ORYPU